MDAPRRSGRLTDDQHQPHGASRSLSPFGDRSDSQPADLPPPPHRERSRTPSRADDDLTASSQAKRARRTFSNERTPLFNRSSSNNKRNPQPRSYITHDFSEIEPLRWTYHLTHTHPMVFDAPPSYIPINLQDPPCECFFPYLTFTDSGVPQSAEYHAASRSTNAHLCDFDDLHHSREFAQARQSIQRAANAAFECHCLRRTHFLQRYDAPIAHILMLQTWSYISMALQILAIRYDPNPPNSPSSFLSNDTIHWLLGYCSQITDPTCRNTSDAALTFMNNVVLWHSRDLSANQNARVSQYDNSLAHTPFARERALTLPTFPAEHLQQGTNDPLPIAHENPALLFWDLHLAPPSQRNNNCSHSWWQHVNPNFATNACAFSYDDSRYRLNTFSHTNDDVPQSPPTHNPILKPILKKYSRRYDPSESEPTRPDELCSSRIPFSDEERVHSDTSLTYVIDIPHGTLLTTIGCLTNEKKNYII